MIIRNCVILILFISTGLSAATPAKERPEPTISECAAKGGECDETKGRPVCGTDDQTYPSRCHLIRAQCSGHQVSLKYRGPCKACIEARAYALKHKAFAKSPPKFIPRCKSDGTYAPVQCLGDSGCWCSDITGKPIENTSVRTGKPRCREFNKANIRRSPTRHLNPNRASGRRSCTQSDRALFNTNLIKVYQGEYLRTGLHKDASVAPADKTVIEWKFAVLDANENNVLDKSEYRELKKTVKRAVKPRRCSRAFGKFCDIDSDDKLSRVEWSNCLSKDGVNRHHESNRNNGASGYLTPSVANAQPNHQNSNSNSNKPSPHQNSNQNQNPNHNLHKLSLDELESDDDNESSQNLGDYNDSDDYDTDDGEEDDNISTNSFGSMVSTKFPSIHFLRPKMVDSEPVLRDSEGESDCLADRAVALDEQKYGGIALYVPECTADGRYQRVQCYRSTGYCWCVHEDTGKNIPATSVKDKRPQCDSIYPISRPMKGCPEPRKTEFLKNLKEFLKEQIGANANTGVNTTKWNSEDERIGTLSFVFLDKNKNKAWERKEWKTFRELVTANKTLGKCGKKMPRYCDVNSDKKITLSEWLNCLQAQRVEADAQKATEKAEAVTNKPSKLNGPNPLESYLKE